MDFSRASSVLRDVCLKKVVLLKSRSDVTQTTALSYKDTLKYALLYDPLIFVEINQPTSFSIYEGESSVPIVDGPAISEARLTDFFLGASRVQTHYDDLRRALANSTSAAWLLVTAYYCSFFSANELLKLNDRIPLALDTDDLKVLAGKASGPGCSAFFSNGPATFVGRPRAGRMVFESSGEKPHVAVWSAMCSLLRSTFEQHDWIEIQKYVELLSNSTRNPSQIRNKWNYKRADYFGKQGEQLGSEMKKLIRNHANAIKWINRYSPDADHCEAGAIASLCELSAPAIIDVYKRART